MNIICTVSYLNLTFFFFFNQATELLLYGRRLTADQALRHGLVSEVLWHSNLMNEVIPRVQIIVSQPLQVNILHWNSFFIITTLYQKQWANLVLKFLHLCISWLQCHFRASKSLIYCIRISVDWFNLEILQKHMREFIDIVDSLKSKALKSAHHRNCKQWSFQFSCRDKIANFLIYLYHFVSIFV